MGGSGLRQTLQQLSTVLAPPAARDQTDGELLRAYCADRDEAAFAALIQRHGRLVLAVCGRLLPRWQDREDVFQATFLALARDAAAVRRRDSVAGWLHGVARHIALDTRRAARRRHHYEGQAMTGAAPNPAWEAAWHEVQLVLDQAIGRLPERYREPFVLCCLENLSRAEAAARLGIKEGTVGSRLTEARRRLRAALARRGVDLTAVLAAAAVASATAQAGAPATLAAAVTRTAARLAAGQALTADLVSDRIRSLVRGVPRAMSLTTRTMTALFLVALTLVAGGVTAFAYYSRDPDVPPHVAQPVVAVPQPDAKPEAVVWKQEKPVRMPGWLPWSAAYAPDGKTLVLGGTGGHVIALDPATRHERWKADVGGDHAAVAFTADGLSVLATYRDGVRFLDAATGQPGTTFEEKNSGPTAVAVFPDVDLNPGAQPRVIHKLIFGNRQRYYVKTWVGEKAPSTISLSTSAPNGGADAYAVPLAVEPNGNRAIVTGPIDRDTGKNILWAWAAGNHGPGRPGNRVLEGHEAVVVSAAWSRDGKTAATGDAAGRVIVWDARTMTELHRVELGARVGAVALSPDGKTRAAVALAGPQAKFYAWTAGARKEPQPIHADAGDYDGPVHACLAFAPDGRQLVGGAMNRDWLNRLGELIGTLHVWRAE